MKRLATIGAAIALVAAAGCSKDDPNALLNNPPSGVHCTMSGSGGSTSMASGGNPATTGGATTSAGSGAGGSSGVPPKTVLDQRVLSYTEALRTASFKLVGESPTLKDIKKLDAASDKAGTYASMVEDMLNDVRFKARMVEFWKNTMRMGGPADAKTGKPTRDTGPTFAARLTVEGGKYTDLFTASTNTCPTFDGANFVDGSCANGPVTAGVLTDPGVNAQYYGNLAFRRHRFIQEVFVCHKLPAELTKNTIMKGGGTYTSPWPFESVATKPDGRIDFQDTSSAICANCHSSANHRAPLLAQFDINGQYQPLTAMGEYAVQIPVDNLPLAVITDWLPAGEVTAWRDPKMPGCMEYQNGLYCGTQATDLAQFGALMIQDPEVLACPVRRMWNYAMSKGDIVNDAADLPTEVIQSYITAFTAGNYNLRTILKSMILSDDFVRF